MHMHRCFSMLRLKRKALRKVRFIGNIEKEPKYVKLHPQAQTSKISGYLNKEMLLFSCSLRNLITCVSSTFESGTKLSVLVYDI